MSILGRMTGGGDEVGRAAAQMGGAIRRMDDAGAASAPVLRFGKTELSVRQQAEYAHGMVNDPKFRIMNRDDIAIDVANDGKPREGFVRFTGKSGDEVIWGTVLLQPHETAVEVAAPGMAGILGKKVPAYKTEMVPVFDPHPELAPKPPPPPTRGERVTDTIKALRTKSDGLKSRVDKIREQKGKQEVLAENAQKAAEKSWQDAVKLRKANDMAGVRMAIVEMVTHIKQGEEFSSFATELHQLHATAMNDVAAFRSQLDRVKQAVFMKEQRINAATVGVEIKEQMAGIGGETQQLADDLKGMDDELLELQGRQRGLDEELAEGRDTIFNNMLHSKVDDLDAETLVNTLMDRLEATVAVGDDAVEGTTSAQKADDIIGAHTSSTDASAEADRIISSMGQ